MLTQGALARVLEPIGSHPHNLSAPPYVFAGVQQGGVEIFFNDANAVAKELPQFKDRSIGGTLTL